MKAFEKLQKTRFFTTDLLAKDCRIKKSTNKEVCANVLLKIIKNQKNYCKNRKNILQRGTGCVIINKKIYNLSRAAEGLAL